MHKRYLWTDRRGADLHWSALGNVKIGPTDQGTLLYWVRKPYGYNRWYDDLMWAVVCSDTNMLRSRHGRSAGVLKDGVWYAHTSGAVNYSGAGAWELHCHQWDFAQGKLWSYYNNAEPTCEVLTGVPAPSGSAQYLQIGNPYTDPTVYKDSDLWWHTVAIWDGLLTVEQIQALYARGYLDEVRPEDGTGNLLFLLRLNEGLTADVAGGDPACTVGVTTPASRWCLMEEGIRELGTAIYPLGMPRHDGSEDDRLPLGAVCRLTTDLAWQQAAISDLHETNYARLKVQNFTDFRVAGAYFPTMTLPGTYRQLIHVPDEGNVPGYEMGIGPIAYKHYPSTSTGVYDQFGSGRRFTVVTDTGNGPSAFKTDLSSSRPPEYWVGAWVHLYSGNCRGYRARLTDFDGETGVMTLDTALPATPEAGSVGMVNFYPRLLGQQADGTLLYDYTMEANLWARHNDSKHFVMLEWIASPNTGCLRYDRGRTAVIPGATYNALGRNAMYGKGYGYSDTPSTELEIWLRKIELAGPQRYQAITRKAQRQGAALADYFFVRTRDCYGNGGDSVKVWRKQAVSLIRERPVKQTNYQAVTADLQAPDTWRQTVDSPPFPVAYDEQREIVTCALVGKDAAGVRRLGYVQGQWNPETGRILWTDEPPPVGKSNPVLEMSTLRSDRESDAPAAEPVWISNLLPAPDGSWSLLYCARPDLVDAQQIFCLHGAPDRWSFDFAAHYAGPLVPMFGGVDSREPLSGNGFVPWMNMHGFWTVWENPQAPASQRYLAYVGGKTIYNAGTQYSVDIRPVVGCRGADLRSLRPLPHGNALTPCAGSNMHDFTGTALGQADAIGLLYADGITSGVGLMTSEDGVHFQMLFKHYGAGEPLLPYSELPGESFHLIPAPTLRLGDRRVYYYRWDQYLNFATIRWNGETSYRLDEGQTEGWLETAILERPEGGWGELYLNAAPQAGTIQVELRGPATETPLSGWTRSASDVVPDSLRGRVTWQGAGLAECTASHLRLRFYLTRPSAGQATPLLYGWEIGPLVVPAPRAEGLLVQGQVAPAGLGQAHPTLSWTYRDPEGRPQQAWQVQVASSLERLTCGTPDMWDTGIRLGAQTSVVYAGQPLGDYQTYFWRVRVRNDRGVWSEEW